jgi:hypothetical protein
MKDRSFIYYGNPCTICMSDPAIQNFTDVDKQGRTPCRYYPERSECSAPRFGCVQLAGAAMARYLLQFYSEATEETLAMEKEEFRRRAPLPPDQVEAYIDTPDEGYRQVTDPDLVVERVWEYARAVLDLKPGERIFRSSEETWEPPISVQIEQIAGEEAEPSVPAAGAEGEDAGRGSPDSREARTSTGGGKSES